MADVPGRVTTRWLWDDVDLVTPVRNLRGFMNFDLEASDADVGGGDAGPWSP